MEENMKIGRKESFKKNQIYNKGKWKEKQIKCVTWKGTIHKHMNSIWFIYLFWIWMKILESMANGSIKIPNGIYKIISKNNAIIPVAVRSLITK